MMITKKVILIINLMLFATSCSYFSSAYDVAKEHISITWKKESDDQKPIDSIVVKFNPVYWKEYKKNDTNSTEIDRVIDGYQVWILEVNNIRYNEVKKLDTIIYIYRK